MFYPPLLLGGPITTFNAWASHMHKPQTSYTSWQSCIYLLRWAACFLLLEVGMHYSPLLAFAKHGVPLHDSFLRPRDIIGASVWQLNYMWLKFLVLWRFHRAWALLEGFETPENMTACVNNNFSLREFWKGWHRSFNQWLVRYLFVPLGGSRVPMWRQMLNIALVFSFVAVWHDVSPSLLLWGWLFILAFIPELSAAAWANSQHWTAQFARRGGMMRILTGIGGAVNIFALIVANFIGYANSQAGAVFLLKAAFVVTEEGGNMSPNWLVIGFSFMMLFSTAQLVALRHAMDADSALHIWWSSRSTDRKPKGN
jgi:D-alanyl-lipoteichoic acid acyltransferase DltB (MBOAT superfamily)